MLLLLFSLLLLLLLSFLLLLLLLLLASSGVHTLWQSNSNVALSLNARPPRQTTYIPHSRDAADAWPVCRCRCRRRSRSLPPALHGPLGHVCVRASVCVPLFQ